MCENVLLNNYKKIPFPTWRENAALTGTYLK